LQSSIALAVWLQVISVASAQQSLPKIVDFNKHVWINYSGEHAVSSNWGIHFDAQWRRADLATNWQQLQFRPAVNYRISPKVMLTAGYAFTRVYPYGDFPALRAFPE